jgi:hypothetical protein
LIVRISKGQFEPARAGEVEERLRESELSLRPAILALPGMLDYSGVRFEPITNHEVLWKLP